MTDVPVSQSAEASYKPVISAPVGNLLVALIALVIALAILIYLANFPPSVLWQEARSHARHVTIPAVAKKKGKNERPAALQQLPEIQIPVDAPHSARSTAIDPPSPYRLSSGSVKMTFSPSTPGWSQDPSTPTPAPTELHKRRQHRKQGSLSVTLDALDQEFASTEPGSVRSRQSPNPFESVTESKARSAGLGIKLERYTSVFAMESLSSEGRIEEIADLEAQMPSRDPRVAVNGFAPKRRSSDSDSAPMQPMQLATPMTLCSPPSPTQLEGIDTTPETKDERRPSWTLQFVRDVVEIFAELIAKTLDTPVDNDSERALLIPVREHHRDGAALFTDS